MFLATQMDLTRSMHLWHPCQHVLWQSQGFNRQDILNNHSGKATMGSKAPMDIRPPKATRLLWTPSWTPSHNGQQATMSNNVLIMYHQSHNGPPQPQWTITPTLATNATTMRNKPLCAASLFRPIKFSYGGAQSCVRHPYVTVVNLPC